MKNNVFLVNIPIIKTEPSIQLQRTDEWFSKRLGLFTGSKISDLMGTAQSESKLEWGRDEKMISFSETAIKYIYSKAKEIQSGKVLKTAKSKSMDWGVKMEKKAIELFLEKNKNFIYKEQPFVTYNDILGASPDGLMIDNITGECYNVEVKCADSWNGMFERLEESFDIKHKDYWQIQTEMLVTGTQKTIYIIAEPPESYDDTEIKNIDSIILNSDEFMQKIIVKRSIIANQIKLNWLKFNGTKKMRQCLIDVVKTFDYNSEFEKIGTNKNPSNTTFPQKLGDKFLPKF